MSNAQAFERRVLTTESTADTEGEGKGATANKKYLIEVDEITSEIIGAAIKVHSALGPGLLESAYEACLMYELSNRGLVVCNQVPLPIRYGEILIEVGYRIDLMVADEVAPIHKAQLLSYLKLSRKKIGLLINFNVELLKNGITRMAN
jgi:GxxExxY protein